MMIQKSKDKKGGNGQKMGGGNSIPTRKQESHNRVCECVDTAKHLKVVPGNKSLLLLSLSVLIQLLSPFTETNEEEENVQLLYVVLHRNFLQLSTACFPLKAQTENMHNYSKKNYSKA